MQCVADLTSLLIAIPDSLPSFVFFCLFAKRCSISPLLFILLTHSLHTIVCRRRCAFPCGHALCSQGTVKPSLLSRASNVAHSGRWQLSFAGFDIAIDALVCFAWLVALTNVSF